MVKRAALAVLLLAVVGVAACGHPSVETGGPPWAAAFRDSDVPALIGLLSSAEIHPSGAPLASLAAYKLAEVGDMRAAPPLADALRSNPDPSVRRAAAEALAALKSVDAVPVLIDAFTDREGRHDSLRQGISAITGQNVEWPDPIDRTGILKLQRDLRGWWAANEAALRSRVGQPGPSKIRLGDLPPPQDPKATVGQVAGQYLGTLWNFHVVLLLREDGYFELRAQHLTDGSHWPIEAGTWAVGPQGLELLWKLAKPITWEAQAKHGDLAPLAGGPKTTVARWSADAVYLYPECREPYCFTLGRASSEQLAALDPYLQYTDVDAVIGSWATRTATPTVQLTLARDGTFSQVYDRGEHSGLAERAAGTATGTWDWDGWRRELRLNGTRLLKPDGSPSGYAAPSDEWVMKDGTLTGNHFDREETLYPQKPR